MSKYMHFKDATRHGRYCLDSGLTRPEPWVTIPKSESESESESESVKKTGLESKSSKNGLESESLLESHSTVKHKVVADVVIEAVVVISVVVIVVLIVLVVFSTRSIQVEIPKWILECSQWECPICIMYSCPGFMHFLHQSHGFEQGWTE